MFAAVLPSGMSVFAISIASPAERHVWLSGYARRWHLYGHASFIACNGQWSSNTGKSPARQCSSERRLNVPARSMPSTPSHGRAGRNGARRQARQITPRVGLRPTPSGVSGVFRAKSRLHRFESVVDRIEGPGCPSMRISLRSQTAKRRRSPQRTLGGNTETLLVPLATS
jgi:hypothetical protein